MPLKPYLLTLSIACASLMSCGDKSNDVNQDPVNQTDTTGDDATNPSPGDTTDTDPSNTDETASTLNIVAGTSVGGAELGRTFAEIKTVLGEPDTARGYNRMIICAWAALGLEISFSSPLDFEIADSAIALAMNTVTDSGFSGDATPGMTKSQVENSLGVSTDETQGFSFYAEGIVVEYDENNIAIKIGIYAPYVVRAEPPEMLPAVTTMDDAQ